MLAYIGRRVTLEFYPWYLAASLCRPEKPRGLTHLDMATNGAVAFASTSRALQFQERRGSAGFLITRRRPAISIRVVAAVVWLVQPWRGAARAVAAWGYG